MPHRKLVAKLQATSAVTTLVPAARIRPIKLAQSSPLPGITYEVTSRTTDDGIDGTSSTVLCEVTVTCWGTTYDQAWQVAEAVHAALHYYRESNAAGKLMQCRCTMQADAPEMVDEASDEAIHAVSQTYEIDYRLPEPDLEPE